MYCADGSCLIVPKICGNVSRIRMADARGVGDDTDTAANTARARELALLEPRAGSAPEADIGAADAVAELASPLAILDGLPTLEELLEEDDEDAAARRLGFDLMPQATGWPDGGPDSDAVSPVPEPSGWALFLAGAGALLSYSRFRQWRQSAAAVQKKAAA